VVGAAVGAHVLIGGSPSTVSSVSVDLVAPVVNSSKKQPSVSTSAVMIQADALVCHAVTSSDNAWEERLNETARPLAIDMLADGGSVNVNSGADAL
jgi:hypothetical protein